jgi:hypothetical protein
LHVDDRYNKLRNNIGNDFSKVGKVKELYSFQCGKCGYRNIYDVNEMICGCGNHLKGTLVYRKVDDTVIYDNRERRDRRK